MINEERNPYEKPWILPTTFPEWFTTHHAGCYFSLLLAYGRCVVIRKKPFTIKSYRKAIKRANDGRFGIKAIEVLMEYCDVVNGKGEIKWKEGKFFEDEEAFEAWEAKQSD